MTRQPIAPPNAPFLLLWRAKNGRFYELSYDLIVIYCSPFNLITTMIPGVITLFGAFFLGF
jgi:hypothetical protein